MHTHLHAPMHECVHIKTNRPTHTFKITNHQPRKSNFGWIAASLCRIIARIRLKAVSFQYQSGCNEGWMTLGKSTIVQTLLLINVADVRNMNWIFLSWAIDVIKSNHCYTQFLFFLTLFFCTFFCCPISHISVIYSHLSPYSYIHKIYTQLLWRF